MSGSIKARGAVLPSLKTGMLADAAGRCCAALFVGLFCSAHAPLLWVAEARTLFVMRSNRPFLLKV